MRPVRMLSVVFLVIAGFPVGCSSDDPINGNDNNDDGGVDTESETDPWMQEGDVVELSEGSGGVLELELELESGDENFVLLVGSGSRLPGASYSYDVSVEGEKLGALTSTGPMETFDGAGGSFSADVLAYALDAIANGASAIAPPPVLAPTPDVGEMVPITLNSGSGYVTVDCEVMVVSDDLVIVFDRTTTADLSIDAGVLAEMSANFSDLVLPRERIYFGQESDINADEHVTMVFSPLVYDGSGGATAYVFPCDLLPDGAAGCPASNEQEVIYVSPPDMLPSYMASAGAITETVAHEFQHAIYFYRKFMLTDNVDASESAYVTEGMSAVAQDVSGFQAGNLYVAGAAIEGVNDVSIADVLAYPLGYDAVNDGVYRGAAYLLLRYLFDRAGGDTIGDDGVVVDNGGVAFLNNMSELGLFGYEGVEAAAQWGVGLEELIMDMYTAMLLDDRLNSDGKPLNDDPSLGFAEVWNDPITGNQHGVTMNFELAGGSWLVRGVPIQQGGVDGTIKAGGAEYILIDGSLVQDGSISIEVTADDGCAPAARLVRVK